MELIQLGDQANSDPQFIYFKLRLGRYPRRRQPTRSGFPHDFDSPQKQLLCCPALLAIAYSFTCAQATADDSQESTPLRILLITSGCCHDYDFQTKAMQLALKERGVSAKWDVVDEGGKGTSAQIDLYNNSDWAKGYDLVIHNECFATLPTLIT